LKLKWPVGNRYIYRMDIAQNQDIKIAQMPNSMKQEVNMGMNHALTVLKETEGGGHELELEFLAQEMDLKMGDMVMNFDSKSDSLNDAQNPFAGPMRKLIGSKLKYLMSADNKVEKIEGIGEFIKKLTAGGSPQAAMVTQMFNEDYFKQLVDYGRGMPSKPVKIGESWAGVQEVGAGPLGKMILDLTHTFSGWEEREKRKCAVLDFTGTVKSRPGNEPGPMGTMTIENGKISGKNWFDPELGAVVESAIEQKMAVKIIPSAQLGGPGGQNITSDLTQKINVRLADLSKAAK